ncbi:MAG: hypothetical protein ACSHX4_10430 [Opitutaceae bacterium]
MTETSTSKAKDDELGIFLTILFGGLGLALLITIIVGIFTIARNWEDTNLTWNHKQESFTIETSSWWGLKKQSTEYKHTALKGWCWIDAAGKEHGLRDIDQTKANIKDAADGESLETKTNVLQSQMPGSQSK